MSDHKMKPPSDDILTNTAPERIWLIVDPDDLDQQHQPWPGEDGVTWCADAVGGAAVEYVRADLANRALEEARLLIQHASRDRWGP